MNIFRRRTAPFWFLDVPGVDTTKARLDRDENGLSTGTFVDYPMFTSTAVHITTATGSAPAPIGAANRRRPPANAIARH